MLVLSQDQQRAKLNVIVDAEGFDSVEELFEAAVFDSICPSICCNEDCQYIEELEGDQTEGHCPECNTQSMQSALILGGLI